MIAIDSSSLIAYLGGDAGRDVELVERALADRQVCLPPVVVAELLSDPKLPEQLVRLIENLPVLAVTAGYWYRAGRLRAAVLKGRRRARLADTLISQSCIDHETPLITRDADFASFARVSTLKLLP